ncbi:hypothetical protein BUE67_15650, partial [Corynebacterium diphtheriae]
MIHHGKAVRRGADDTFIVVDLPIGAVGVSAEHDMILVGDSLGMTVLGYDTTTQVTLDDMIHHGKAVRRGADDTFIVVD